MFATQYDSYDGFAAAPGVSKFDFRAPHPFGLQAAGAVVAAPDDGCCPGGPGPGPGSLATAGGDPLIDPLTGTPLVVLPDPLAFGGGSGAGGAANSNNNPAIVGSSSAAVLYDTSNNINTSATTSSNGHIALIVGGVMDPIADDLAAQEAAAREFQPQLEGPLVGDKTLSHVIAKEYAKADPVYVEKTMALPQTYSHYRPILGDGNCGWRAIGFCYFETLINCANKALIDGEVDRLLQLNQYLLNVGQYSPFTYEDMAEETVMLLREVSASIETPEQALSHVLEKFNSQDSSNAIIYHLRLLAASYLKGNENDFAGFIQGDRGVQGYCTEWLERPGQEIDHLGVSLLVEVLLKPIGFGLEIALLDRTPGSQVNSFRLPPETSGQDPTTLGPMMYLLYRPGHYDILYRNKVEVPTNLVAFISHDFKGAGTISSQGTYCTMDFTPFFMVPGLPEPQSDSSAGQTYTSSPTSQWFPSPPPFGDALPASSPTCLSPCAHTTAYGEPCQLLHAPPPPPHHLPPGCPHHLSEPPRRRRKTRSNSPPPHTPQSLLAPPALGGLMPAADRMVRFSEFHFAYSHLVENSASRGSRGSGNGGDGDGGPASPVVFQSATAGALPPNIYQNSHFNTAHYNNPNFQPEEYCPGINEDGTVHRSAGLRKRSRSPRPGEKRIPIRKKTL